MWCLKKYTKNNVATYEIGFYHNGEFIPKFRTGYHDSFEVDVEGIVILFIHFLNGGSVKDRVYDAFKLYIEPIVDNDNEAIMKGFEPSEEVKLIRALKEDK